MINKVWAICIGAAVSMLVLFGCAKSTKECIPACVGSLECCGGICVDVQNNDENCGRCDYKCSEGTSCSRGECVETCGEDDLVCSSSETCCDGECTNTNYDVENCGECGNACEQGQVCEGGSCTTLTCDPPCEEGETCCKVGVRNECVDLQTDRNNCGACGETCGLNEVCKAGVCTADVCEPPCAEGWRCCGGECVDTQSDMENCGFCGNVCDPDAADGCTAGQCSCRGALACSTGQKCCEGVGCRNVTTDPSNCGECGHQCRIGESCVEGECHCGTGPACTETESCCSGACIDTAGDPANCGGCGMLCDENGPDCVAGTCMCGTSPACQYGYPGFIRNLNACQGQEYEAFQKCCDGACVPMGPENCGACGVVCEEWQICEGTYMFQCVFSCTGTPPPDPVTPDASSDATPDGD